MRSEGLHEVGTTLQFCSTVIENQLEGEKHAKILQIQELVFSWGVTSRETPAAGPIEFPSGFLLGKSKIGR